MKKVKIYIISESYLSYMNRPQRKGYESAVLFVTENNGEVLTSFEDYSGVSNPILIRCNECGKVFEEKPINLYMRKSFCPNCEKNNFKRKTKDEMIEIIQKKLDENNATIENLEEIYKNKSTKLIIKCERGHVFEESWSYFSKRKNLCPYCMKENNNQVSKTQERVEIARKSLGDHPTQSEVINEVIVNGCMDIYNEYTQNHPRPTKFLLEFQSLLKKVIKRCLKYKQILIPVKLTILTLYLIDGEISLLKLCKRFNFTDVAISKFFKKLKVSKLTVGKYKIDRQKRGGYVFVNEN